MKQLLLSCMLILVLKVSAQLPGVIKIDRSKLILRDSIGFESGVPPTFNLVNWRLTDTTDFGVQSARNGSKAIGIDSLKPGSGYSAIAEFYLPHDSFPFGSGNINFTFWHRFNFDTLSAGELEISTDHENYFNLLSDSNEFVFWDTAGLYSVNNTLFNGRAGFKGSSDGWIRTEVNLTYFILVKRNVSSFSLRWKYTSQSDSASANYWYIDDFTYGSEARSGGLQDRQSDAGITVYPNPAKDKIAICSVNSFINAGASVSIQTLDGREAKNIERLTDLTLDVSDLTPGFYILKLSNGDKVLTRRIVIN